MVYASRYHWIGREPSEFRSATSIGNVINRLTHAFRQVLPSSHSLTKFEEHSRNYNCSRLRLKNLLRFSLALQTFRVFHSSISRRYTLEHESIVKAWSLTDFPGLPGGPRLPWLPGGPCQTRLKQGVKQIKMNYKEILVVLNSLNAALLGVCIPWRHTTGEKYLRCVSFVNRSSKRKQEQ